MLSTGGDGVCLDRQTDMLIKIPSMPTGGLDKVKRIQANMHYKADCYHSVPSNYHYREI